MLLLDVKTEFQRQIREKFKTHPNVTAFLLTHERLPLVLGNLCNQVLIYEKKAGNAASLNQRNAIIKMAVDMFSYAALKLKHEQNMSEIQRQKVAHEGESKHDLSIMQDAGTTVKDL